MEEFYCIYIDEPNLGSNTEAFVKINHNTIVSIKDTSRPKKYQWDGWKINLNILIGKTLDEALDILSDSLNETKYTSGEPYVYYTVISKKTYYKVTI
jgi:hypothetical protein